MNSTNGKETRCEEDVQTMMSNYYPYDMQEVACLHLKGPASQGFRGNLFGIEIALVIACQTG
jgi:hypothetical protein